MKSPGRLLSHSALLSAWLCLIATLSRADLRQFTVDESQSSLTISGTFAGFDIEPQSPGSLKTSYGGIIEAEVTSTNILFLGGSMIAARTNGNWQPASGGTAGSAPANYGGQVVNLLVTGKAALRDVLLDVTSEELAVSGGTFSSQGLQFRFIPNITSVIDYNYDPIIGDPGSGSQALTGSSTNSVSTNATLVAQGDETVLTMPVDISGSVSVANPNDVQYRFRGQLVARASMSAPLQIKSFQFSPGQLNFTIATTPGQSYAILGSTNLQDWPTVVDQFMATNHFTERMVPLPAPVPEQYFSVRRD